MSDHDERDPAPDIQTEERPPEIPPELPVLPLRDTVLFPNSFMPLAVAREASVRLINDAVEGSKLIAVFTQRDASDRGADSRKTCTRSGPRRTSTRCSSCPTAACASSSRGCSGWTWPS